MVTQVEEIQNTISIQNPNTANPDCQWTSFLMQLLLHAMLYANQIKQTEENARGDINPSLHTHCHFQRQSPSMPAQRIAAYCRLRLEFGPMSGLALLLPSPGLGPMPIFPIAGNSGPGLWYPPPIGMDIAYAGVLYGLTPVVISATLGNICIPLPICCIPIPPPIAARAIPSLGLVGGTDLGVLSLRAAIALADPPLFPLP